MKEVRLVRAGYYITLVVVLLAPVYAIFSGQDRDLIGISLLAAIAFLIILQNLYFSFLKPCGPTGTALEIHKDHLVLATAQGLVTIPKSAIQDITPVDFLVRPMVTLFVDADYKIPGWLGFRVNPTLSGLFVAGETDITIRGALISWLRP